jgi:PAS domain S-box-containing protein
LSALVRDVSERRAIERARDESEQTLRELGANLPALLWVRETLSGRLVYANAGWTAILGSTPTPGGSFHQLIDAVHPDDRHVIFDGSSRALGGQWEGVVRLIDHAGAIGWYRFSAFAIRDEHGEPYRVAGFAVNVSERVESENRIRASLREKEVLLKEIHHRVKNNLQVVSSLLSLQAMKARDPGLSSLLSESQGRVTAMALVHEILYGSPELSRIPFTAYARALGGSVCRTYGVGPATITLVVDGGELTLDVDTAIPCGLLMNEILSNSLRHAFPSGARGTLRVELAQPSPHAYRLHVSDDGIGLPVDFEERQRSALGTKLIHKLVEQLGGSLSRHSSAHGTRYDVEFSD